MVDKAKHIEDLREIRDIMEKSTLFLSLSGLSGIFAGAFALIGAAAAYFYLGHNFTGQAIYDGSYINTYSFLIVDALIVLICSLMVAIILTKRRAAKDGTKVWNSSSRRLLINLMIPLVAGGLFTLEILLIYPGLAVASTLIFYGLALVNGSKYTHNEVRILGVGQVVLGLFSAWWIGYGLIFWALGFGVLHIIYGFYMYKKYES